MRSISVIEFAANLTRLLGVSILPCSAVVLSLFLLAATILNATICGGLVGIENIIPTKRRKFKKKRFIIHEDITYKMTSAVCHRFVQNAWRKERCSNCFKSREEHAKHDAATAAAVLKRAAAATAARRGIMRAGSGAARRKRAVSFKTELTEIIGYGGEDWSEDVEAEEGNNEDAVESSEDDSSLSENEDLEKLTKSNTEHNANITVNSTTTERRRTFTQLMLGQPQKDADGKKQTLLVSVTPFGHEEPDKTPPKRFAKTVSHIPIARNKEILAEAKPKVILTSYSKSRDFVENSKPVERKLQDKEKEDRLVKAENAKTGEKKSHEKEERVIKTETLKTVERKLYEKEKEERIVKMKVDMEKRLTKQEKVEEVESVKNKATERLEEQSEPVVDRTIDMTCVGKEKENKGEEVKENNVERNEEFVEEVMKTELNVKLSTPPSRPLPPAPAPTLPVDRDDQENSGESSEESADSLMCVAAGSREQAGEPDGRADPDTPPHCINEPPALPLQPPPTPPGVSSPQQHFQSPQARTSFLHGSPANVVVSDKPKIPLKPDKPPQQTTKKLIEPQPPVAPAIIPQQDLSKTPNKRRAPNPPPNLLPETLDPPQLENHNIDLSESTISRNHQGTESPILKQPTREFDPVDSVLSPCSDGKMITSVSSDSLAISEKIEEKRKEKSKPRFSLKKFLRVGGSAKSTEKRFDDVLKEKLKPRLVIVHPLELNGAGVEVMPAGVTLEEQRENVKPMTPKNNPHTSSIPEIIPPAPPPRNLSQKSTDESKLLSPPPKPEELLRRQQHTTTPTATPTSSDSLYANLGEVRSTLPPPSKPQRTASMREREAQLEHEAQLEEERREERRNNIRRVEHVYERLSPRRRNTEEDGREGSARCKSVSSQSGSDDLELFSNSNGYFANGDCELSDSVCPSTRPSCQLRSRKGRSVVHRNLEDNYGAVVVANHEALAQVLEHLVQQPPPIPVSLRPLHHTSTLRWSDFSVLEGCVCAVGRRRAFHRALWAGAHRVTLAVSGGPRAAAHRPSSAPVGVFTLRPITVFDDLVPKRFLPSYYQGDTVNSGTTSANDDVVQATIAVLPWLQVDTIQSVGVQLRTRGGVEATRDACVILLQLVHSLKGVQAQGVEEAPLSLTHIVLCHDPDRDTQHRLCLLHGLSEEFSRNDESEVLGSLCQCATVAVDELFPPGKLATLIRSLLKKESAISLTQVKSILEFFLWGPSDVALGVPVKDRELALQRWLDLERATVLHGLVGTRIQLTVLEECHLLFLVRSSAKVMCESSILLEANS